MARSMMLTLARTLALPILALFALPAGAGEMMHVSMMVDSTTVTVERASAVWGDGHDEPDHGVGAATADGMAMMSPDGEMSADEMARLGDIAPAAGPLDPATAAAAVQP